MVNISIEFTSAVKKQMQFLSNKVTTEYHISGTFFSITYRNYSKV